MRVTRLVGGAPVIDADGKWNVFCQVLRGSSYVYGVIICDTKCEALSIKEVKSSMQRKSDLNTELRIYETDIIIHNLRSHSSRRSSAYHVACGCD